MIKELVKIKRSKKELIKASEHLHYEAVMLEVLAQAMASGISKQDWLTNAFVESFAIHVRGLIDFLYNDKPRVDDVVAQDYFNSANQWGKIRPPLSKILENAKKRAGKEIAHITYARLKVAKKSKGWDYLKISNEIKSVLNIFLDNVPRENLCDRWQ